MHQDSQHDLGARCKRLVRACISCWHRYHYQKAPPTLSTTPRVLLRRKTLFTLAIAILLAGAAIRPWSFVFLLWGRNLIAILVAGLLIGTLVREVAAVCLGTNGRLWYTRWIAPILVIVLLVAIHTVLPIADRIVARVFNIATFFSSAASVHVLVPIALMTIALLR